MKKIILITTSFFICISLLTTESVAQKEVFEKHFAFEVGLGPRIPFGISKDDITSGLGVQLNLAYRLTKYFELFNLSIDFGNSSPHNPNMDIVYQYYGYSYGTLAMETVTVFGLPLTTRLHFPVRENITGFIGAGAAYYWFSSRFEAPGYYGTIQLRQRRNRNGFGPIFETGLITDFFSDRWLVMIKGQYSMLETSGESLSIREGIDPEADEERTDKYLMITVGIHYLF